MLISDEDIKKHLLHTLSLKTERGIRNSINIILRKMKESEDELNECIEVKDSYHRSSLELLMNLQHHIDTSHAKFKDYDEVKAKIEGGKIRFDLNEF